MDHNRTKLTKSISNEEFKMVNTKKFRNKMNIHQVLYRHKNIKLAKNMKTYPSLRILLVSSSARLFVSVKMRDYNGAE